MKSDAFHDLENGFTLIALILAHATMIYQNGILLNNSFEIIFTTLMEITVFILFILGFWIIRRDKISRMDSVVVMATVENPENI